MTGWSDVVIWAAAFMSGLCAGIALALWAARVDRETLLAVVKLRRPMVDEERDLVGQFIRWSRAGAGLTLGAVSRATGINICRVSDIELGRGLDVTITELRLIRDAVDAAHPKVIIDA